MPTMPRPSSDARKIFKQVESHIREFGSEAEIFDVRSQSSQPQQIEEGIEIEKIT